MTDATQEAPLRMFTLGIGQTVSTAMCEGIARAGNGVCLMAATSESIIAKSAKLVRASRTHILQNVSIDWGTEVTAPSEATSSTNMNCQAPLKVPALYSGTRFIAFNMILCEDFTIPGKLTIRARLHNSQGEEVTLTVQVDTLPPHSTDDTQPCLIHTLAVRKIIQDLDDGDRTVNSNDVKCAIVHLGEQYQLASRYTSFLAVDDLGVVDPVSTFPPTTNARDGHGRAPHARINLGGMAPRRVLSAAAYVSDNSSSGSSVPEDDFLDSGEDSDNSQTQDTAVPKLPPPTQNGLMVRDRPHKLLAPHGVFNLSAKMLA